jgi:hypothetical protein
VEAQPSAVQTPISPEADDRTSTVTVLIDARGTARIDAIQPFGSVLT